jgi:cytochrome c oxidase subunit 2
MNGAPLGYLTSAGKQAAAVVPLMWFLALVSVAVCVIVGVLLWWGVQRSRAAEPAAIAEGGDAMGWIRWGMALSAVPLTVALVWTLVVLAKTLGPPKDAALTIDVTAQQYWWDVHYTDAAGTFDTANEIHIPTGSAVVVRLHGPDVIHSFWVPQLSGKTDIIPGQTNLASLEADRPGRYRGQCSEYCGLEHAKMAFEVVAETPAQFAAWRAAQAAAASSAAQPGLAVFTAGCARCHAIRGVGGRSGIGPDLTHLMSRRLIAAGSIANNPGNLAGWIADPQSVKPGAKMPAQQLTGRQLTQLVAYLETLK